MEKVNVQSDILSFFQRLSELSNDMISLFSKAMVSKYKEPGVKISLQQQPEVTTAFAESKDPEELEHYWTEAREQTGRKLRDMWIRKMDFSNQVARYESTFYQLMVHSLTKEKKKTSPE